MEVTVLTKCKGSNCWCRYRAVAAVTKHETNTETNLIQSCPFNVYWYNQLNWERFLQKISPHQRTRSLDLKNIGVVCLIT